MRITKEDFYKLPQLDRIEYRQRMDDLPKTGFFSISLWILVITLGLVILLIPQTYIAIGEEGLKIFLTKLILPFRLIGGYISISLLLDVIIILTRINKKREIEEYYFKIITKQNETKR